VVSISLDRAIVYVAHCVQCTEHWLALHDRPPEHRYDLLKMILSVKLCCLLLLMQNGPSSAQFGSSFKPFGTSGKKFGGDAWTSSTVISYHDLMIHIDNIALF
jgi:hypothetical protein